MPITLVTPYTPPADAFPFAHMENLTISLERTSYAKATLVARFRLYRLDANGEKVFDTSKHFDINVEDAEAWVMQLAGQGDMRAAQAMNHVKEIAALLVELKTTLGETVVS